MKPFLFVLCISFGLLAQPTFGQSKPGLVPYTPTRIEWLATVLQAQLRQDITEESRFHLEIVNSDHETILIFVRYLPNVNREVMNTTIQTVREVTMIAAKGYGWDSWVKIREDVQMGKPE